MSVQEVCYGCGLRRSGKWALMFSEPDEAGKCEKLHICPGCFKDLKEKVRE